MGCPIRQQCSEMAQVWEPQQHGLSPEPSVNAAAYQGHVPCSGLPRFSVTGAACTALVTCCRRQMCTAGHLMSAALAPSTVLLQAWGSQSQCLPRTM